MNSPDIIAYIAAACNAIAFFPQVYKIIKIKETKDISLIMYILFLCGISLWLVFGIVEKSLPIIIANAVTLVMASIVLVCKLKYK
jgi:MtN3 and saliva related transmembrane protein